MTKIIFTPSTPKQKKKIENRYKCLLITFCSFSGSLFDLSHRPARGRRWREGTPQSSAGRLGHDPGLSGSPLQVWGSSGPERTSARVGFRVQHFQVERYLQWPRYHWVFSGLLLWRKKETAPPKVSSVVTCSRTFYRHVPPHTAEKLPSWTRGIFPFQSWLRLYVLIGEDMN